jgi:predicted dinucleotide-binding enzyme
VRELDRIPSELPESCAIVGAGRLGHALAAALRAAGIEVDGPLGRGASPQADVVLLCVPDGEIRAAAEAIPPGGPAASDGTGSPAAPDGKTPLVRKQLVGHCSGATTLEPLHPHEAFSLHPLMTVPEGATAPFAGAGCAIAGTTARALATAEALARALSMRPVQVHDEDRAAYHAAASIAANFLVTLEGAAERLAATAGVDRELLVPLARAALENWAAKGAAQALTGPVARGDEATIARQRAAIAERTPDLLDVFDMLVAASRVVVAA